MRYFFATFYLLVLVLLLVYETRHSKDLLSPKPFFIILELLCYPYGLYTKTIDTYMYVTDDLACKTVIVNLIYTFSFLLGYRLFDRIAIKENNVKVDLTLIGRGKSWMIFLVGFFAKLYTFIQLGGIKAIINNVSLAYSSQSSGFGFLFLLYRFMLFATLIELQRYIDERNRKDLVYAIIMAVLYMISYLIYSSRGPAFELILIILFVINYKYKKIKIRSIFSPKILIPLLIIAVISMNVENLRNSGNDRERISNPVIGIMDEYCHIGRDAFVYNYFDSHEFFFGKSVLNMITAFIPSTVFNKKPINDDGLFIINNIKGYETGINDSINDLEIKSGSIPFTNQGILYANFSYLGVIIGAFFLAAFRVLFYKKWALSGNSVLICLYFYGVYMFGFTPLKFVNTVTIFIVFILAIKLNKFRIVYKRKVL